MPPSRGAAASSRSFLRDVRHLLQPEGFGRPIEGHAVLPSTNARAVEWACEGAAAEGSTVVADYQTAGRGRHGRRWASAAGQNLTFSLVLRPFDAAARGTLPVEHHGLIALAAGLAVCEAIASVLAARAPQLKWPNDVLLEGRKCCGLLLETTSAGSRSGPLVLGIGLNVNQCDFPAMPERSSPPTSLALAGGRPVARAPLFAQLIQRVEAHYRSLFADGGRAMLRACEARMTMLGQRVAVRFAGTEETASGIFLGLAPDGAMRLSTDGGERVLYAGDVTTA